MDLLLDAFSDVVSCRGDCVELLQPSGASSSASVAVEQISSDDSDIGERTTSRGFPGSINERDIKENRRRLKEKILKVMQESYAKKSRTDVRRITESKWNKMTKPELWNQVLRDIPQDVSFYGVKKFKEFYKIFDDIIYEDGKFACLKNTQSANIPNTQKTQNLGNVPWGAGVKAGLFSMKID